MNDEGKAHTQPKISEWIHKHIIIIGRTKVFYHKITVVGEMEMERNSFPILFSALHANSS